MTYVEGFVIAVPTANKDVFRDHAAAAAPMFREFGATRVVECWGDDVPAGKVNDFAGAVRAKSDETVVFSWLEYPDKAARDAAKERMMADERMEAMGEMPFDGMRMIFAGFRPHVEVGAGGDTGYVDGFVLPVPDGNKDAYFQMAREASAVFLDHGATRFVECWGDDVPNGKVTDYRRAAHAKDGETVVFSWIEWPSKAARDSGMKATMEDPRIKMAPETMPFDGARMIFGGFEPLVDS